MLFRQYTLNWLEGRRHLTKHLANETHLYLVSNSVTVVDMCHVWSQKWLDIDPKPPNEHADDDLQLQPDHNAVHSISD